MGFFDRFKKKQEETKQEEQRKQPLTIQYRDGTVAEVNFNGLCEVDGKTVHSVSVIYTDKDNSFTSRSLLLEPIIVAEDNGIDVDATERYYKSMAERDGTQEASARYGALKGFFKKQEITEHKMGSNYIGRVSKKESGEYIRDFDESFRNRCIARTRAENQAREQARVQREDAFMDNLRGQVESRPVNIKTSHAEHLTPEKSPFQGR